MKCPVLLVFLSCAVAMAQTVTAVQDGGAYTNNIAQGSVFVVKGTGLSGAGFVQATAPIYPTTLNSVRITMTAVTGGAVVNPLMVYTYNLSGVNQLAAVLPSTAAVGNYDLRVINGAATSAAFRTAVQARKPGIVTAAGDGSGPAQATLNGELILQRTSNVGKIGDFDTRPARPGERVDLWGTGLGPDVASDTGGTSGNQTAAAQIVVLVDGTSVTPLYAGRSSGFPGLDQIVFNLPANVALTCALSIQVRAGGVLSNPVTIATSTGESCPAPPSGGGGGSPNLTSAEIDTFVARGFYTSGGVSLFKSTTYSAAGAVTRTNSISGLFTRTSGADLGRMLRNQLPPGFPIPTITPGNCLVYNSTQLVDPYPLITRSNLDVGAQLTASGPNGTQSVPRRTNQVAGPTYGTANDFPNTYVVPGRYTLSGPGGTQVGAFSGTLDVVQDFVLTNPTNFVTTINRSVPLTVSWSGGDPSTTLTIQGVTFAGVVTTAFLCIESVGAGQFTVPASILSQIPATPAGSLIPGSFTVTVAGAGTRLPTPSGLDLATANNFWNWQFSPSFQ